MHLRKFMQIPKNTYFTFPAKAAGEGAARLERAGKLASWEKGRRLSKDKRYYSINFIPPRVYEPSWLAAEREEGKEELGIPGKAYQMKQRPQNCKRLLHYLRRAPVAGPFAFFLFEK